MKNRLKELDVDFIGGQEPMTIDEEQAISAFIQADKEKRRLQQPARQKKSTLLTKDKKIISARGNL